MTPHLYTKFHTRLPKWDKINFFLQNRILIPSTWGENLKPLVTYVALSLNDDKEHSRDTDSTRPSHSEFIGPG